MKPKYSRRFSILGAIVFTATAAPAADVNLIVSDPFGAWSFNSAGSTQQETATAVGTITTAGSLAVTVTSATVVGSPLTINVPVALSDTPTTWSLKVVAALNATPAITAQFSAGGTAPAIVLTGNAASPLPTTDATLNIAIANGTAAGITPVVNSANTRNARSWSDGFAPAPGNAYLTGANVLRTPTADANVTFLGDSLRFDPVAGDNNSLLYKIAGNRTVTVNNLILNGGIVANGENNTTFTLAGNVNVTAVSGLRASDAGGRALIVTAPISGSSRLYVGSNSTPQANTFSLSGNNSGFSGGFSLGGTYTNNGAKVFNASSSTLRVGHVSALGTGVLELKEGTMNLNGFSPTGLAGLTVPDAGSATIRTAGSTLTATAVNLGTTTGASLKIDNAGLANPVTAPIASTTLSVNGPSTLSVLGTGLTVGTFPLISHTGAITGAGGYAGLSLALPPGVSGTLLDNPGSLDVNITGIEFIKWTGAISNNWNINSADTNWKTAVGNVATTYQQNAAGGNSVLFDESEAAASPVPISIPAAVSPNAITFNNPTKDYGFSGQAITGTAALVKGGVGTVTFSNGYNATGGVTINGGKVVYTASGPAGSAATPVSTFIAAGATLEHSIAANQNQGAISITGGGILRKSGAGTLTFNNGNSTIALAAGGLIDIIAGKFTLGNFDSQGSNAATNQSDLNIATGATFDAYVANLTVDSLTGAGTYQAGYFGPRNLTVGINGASSTFSGTIKGNGVNGDSQTQLIKRGNGTLTLTGTINARGAYGGSSLEVRGGTNALPSTLILSPTDPLSTTGYTGGGIYMSPGNTDVTVINQTAGTLVGNLLAIGEYGKSTYNFSGGTVNAGRVEFAWNGGGNNGAAELNLSGTARINVNSNGNILMGQYWGRDITINQTSGEVIQFSDAGVTRGGTGKMRFLSGNQNVTWNLSGGTLSIAGMERASGSGFGGGNGILNLNGGILQITNASFAAPAGDANGKPVVAAKVLGDEVTPNSGARIDNYGLAVTFAAPIQHGPTGVFDGGLKVETSVPGGSLTLSGINTYTGNTTVPTGNSLILADNAGLTFVLDGTLNNKVTGAGTVSFSGDFTIDTTFADITNGNSWTLVNAPIPPGTFTSSFSLVGFSEVGVTGVHQKTEGANTWSFNEGTGVLSLSVTSLSGYALWISNYDVGGLDQPTDDAEFDGTENLLEYIFNGNPTVSDPVILPTLNDSGANFVFSFTRVEDTVNDTTQIFQYGSDLTGWTSVNITTPTGPEVTLGTLGVPSAGLRTVTVTIPKSAEVGGKLFGRLKASKP